MLQMAPVGIEDEMISTQRQIDALLLKQSRLAAQLAKQGGWDDDGFPSAIDWIRFNCHVTSTVAGNYLAVGMCEPALCESVQTMESGEIGFAHLLVMARTARAVGSCFDESQLLALARDSSPGKFHYRCLHYRHSVDAKKYTDEAERLTEDRSLRLNAAEDGCLLISGVLDPVAGAAVRGALEPLARPSGKHDDRTREQRLADALHEVCTGGKSPHLQITASLETLIAAAGAQGGETEFSIPLSSATVRRFACDASLARVLLDQSSLVIDVGQATRKIPVGLRKALQLRDKHCRWPGCERSSFYCDAHHLLHWIEGGPTDLDNLILLCKRHHRMHHEGGWQLVIADGDLVPVAPTITFGLPRGPD